jgi:hypothetical protein
MIKLIQHEDIVEELSHFCVPVMMLRLRARQDDAQVSSSFMSADKCCAFV